MYKAWEREGLGLTTSRERATALLRRRVAGRRPWSRDLAMFDFVTGTTTTTTVKDTCYHSVFDGPGNAIDARGFRAERCRSLHDDLRRDRHRAPRVPLLESALPAVDAAAAGGRAGLQRGSRCEESRCPAACGAANI